MRQSNWPQGFIKASANGPCRALQMQAKAPITHFMRYFQGEVRSHKASYVDINVTVNIDTTLKNDSQMGRLMNTYINLPVQDLARSKRFFEALGFVFNDQFSDDTALSMMLGETSFAMLLTHEKFSAFTDKKIADTSKTSQVLIALQLASREAVAEMTAAAVENAGSEARRPEDHGFMYSHAFADPDGHIWEPFWMNAQETEGAA